MIACPVVSYAHLLQLGTTYVIGDNSQNSLDGLLFF